MNLESAPCYRSNHVSAPCRTCGGRDGVVHFARDASGDRSTFCGRHCPYCRLTAALVRQSTNVQDVTVCR
jgi:hypothetical protein